MMIPGMKSRPEAEEQEAFFKYIRGLMTEHPWLVVAHAIPNGGARPARTVMRGGRKVRYSVEGQKLQRQGVRDGIPDVCIPAPRGKYHGLYIEFKRRPYRDTKGRLRKESIRPEQIAYIRWLIALGYLARSAYGSDDAIETLDWYIGLGPAENTAYDKFYEADFLVVNR
jgi:hypothetical protein